MTKKDDDIKQAVTNEINSRMLKLMRTVCVTATAGLLTVLYNIGRYLYERWDALKAAILLFIEITKRSGQ
jgi:hypothetical protein